MDPDGMDAWAENILAALARARDALDRKRREVIDKKRRSMKENSESQERPRTDVEHVGTMTTDEVKTIYQENRVHPFSVTTANSIHKSSPPGHVGRELANLSSIRPDSCLTTQSPSFLHSPLEIPEADKLRLPNWPPPTRQRLPSLPQAPTR